MRMASLVLAATIGSYVLTDQMHHHTGATGNVGTIVFPISCSRSAQEHVGHGLALMHSFLFTDAEDEFRQAVVADPNCAMAYWAEAIGFYRPLAYAPSDADVKQGWKLLEKAPALSPKTQRERDYLDSAKHLYHPDERTYSARNHEYSGDLEKIHRNYPKDREAAVLYALSLLTWADSEHPVQDAKKAIAILQPIFRENPDHPGVAHYLIHAADSPELAPMGLEAARQYAQIAPGAPHALHMPSHIFARLGLWQEDIQSNLASLEAARNLSAAHVGAEHQLHAMEFLEYAYLQIGKNDEAEKMVRGQADIGYDEVDPNLRDYVNRTRANSPALYDLETRDWKAAEALQPDSNAETYNQAITWWARAVAAGHLHDRDAAARAVSQYDALLETTRAGAKPGRAKYMATKRDEVHAWLSWLQGRSQEAIALLRALADEQDAEGKGEIELPAREMLGDLLLEMNRPTDALAEYENSMKVDPNRFNGLYGAGRASELLGQREKERSYYDQLLKNCAAAPSKRPELTHVRESMAESENKSRQ